MEIKLRNVSKKFKDNIVISNVNLTFNEGKIYSFIGRNGCGKTVLLKLICGFYKPTTGKVLYDDIDINKDVKIAPNTRALIENPDFIPTLSGYENLKLLADIQKKIGKKEIENALIAVNLFESKDKLYYKYSLGMKQKLGIAQVIMEDPNVIILDEPFNGIENESVDKLRSLLLEEKSRGKIILIATHIHEDIDVLSDVVYRVDGGKVEEVLKNNWNKKLSNYINNIYENSHDENFFLLWYYNSDKIVIVKVTKMSYIFNIMYLLKGVYYGNIESWKFM